MVECIFARQCETDQIPSYLRQNLRRIGRRTSSFLLKTESDLPTSASSAAFNRYDSRPRSLAVPGMTLSSTTPMMAATAIPVEPTDSIILARL